MSSVSQEPLDRAPGLSKSAFIDFPLAMVLTDPNQTDNPVVYVNRSFSKLTGYTLEATVGRNCRFLQGENTNPRDRKKLRDAISKGEQITVDILNYRANGEAFVNRLLITPLYDSDGKLVFFLGIQVESSDTAGDATRAMALDEQLRELQHRVKNHLSMILGLMRLEANREDPVNSIRTLARRVETLSILYDQLAHGQTDDSTAEQLVPLGAYVSRVSSALQQLDDYASVVVNVSAAPIMFAQDDAARLGLILSEVVTNAMQHAFEPNEQGEISVSLTETGDGINLTVSDNGRGLGDKEWPSPTSLGGMIVKDLVQRVNGSLHVTTGDTGTRVTVAVKRT